MSFSFQPVTLSASTPDDEGMLVLNDDGRLVAVLSKLSAAHGTLQGQWYIEASFQQMPPGRRETFDTLAEIETLLSA